VSPLDDDVRSGVLRVRALQRSSQSTLSTRTSRRRRQLSPSSTWVRSAWSSRRGSPRGLVPLTESTALDHAAAHPTADIITTSYFDHVGPPGETAEARSLASGHVPSGGRQRTGREHRHGIVGSRHRCPVGGGVARPAGAPSEHPKHDLCDARVTHGWSVRRLLLQPVHFAQVAARSGLTPPAGERLSASWRRSVVGTPTTSTSRHHANQTASAMTPTQALSVADVSDPFDASAFYGHNRKSGRMLFGTSVGSE
jgi:hypothetical protein